MDYYFPGRGLMQYALNSEAPSPAPAPAPAPAPVPVPNNSGQNVVYAEPIHSRDPCTGDITSLARENEELKNRISQLEKKVDQLMKCSRNDAAAVVAAAAASSLPGSVCYAHQRGECTRGAHCRFSHSSEAGTRSRK
jgi:hypothetical protein